MIVEFPYARLRRVYARRPRSSKKGTPEQGPAAAGRTPILEAIARYRAAWERQGSIISREPLNADGRIALGTPEYDTWERESDEAGAESHTILRQVLSMRPSTAAEAIALIDCYAEAFGDSDSNESAILLDTLRTFLSHMVTA
jgi:hypothetical protein